MVIIFAVCCTKPQVRFSPNGSREVWSRCTVHYVRCWPYASRLTVLAVRNSPYGIRSTVITARSCSLCTHCDNDSVPVLPYTDIRTVIAVRCSPYGTRFAQIIPRWPAQHWDHWLRDEKQHKGRECVFPEVKHILKRVGGEGRGGGVTRSLLTLVI